jgi:hypothetical protein
VLGSLLIALLACAPPAAAAERPAPAAREHAAENRTAPEAPPVLAADVDWSAPPVSIRPTRGAVLPSLYVSLAGLNAYDAYATTAGLARGAAEANPLLRGVAGSPAALWAVKGGVTASSIVVAERLWRRNRKAAAIAVMAVSNGIMAAVAARNARVLGQAPR